LAERPRAVVTRNPYVRFLSSYLDWRYRFHYKDISFGEFTQFVKDGDFQGNKVKWDHIWPISRECGIDRLGYDYVLRLEEMNIWYDAFLDHFKLRYFVDALAADGFTLFVPTIADNALLRDHTTEITGLAPWGGVPWNSSHHRHAADLLQEYYTPEIAHLVFDIQRVDFENFGYPAWNGDPQTFRLVR